MIARLLALPVLLWALGFVLFTSTLPGPAGDERTDGIIVLTGGPGRLTHGLEALRAGRARRMLISGVDRRVKARELAHAYHIAPALMARIDLGHESVDTRSNADEAERWIVANRYRAIRLVTTDWHMPRARLELIRVAGPKLTLVLDAVRSEPGLVVLLREYDKYLLRCVASPFGG